MTIVRLEAQIRHVLLKLVLVGVGIAINLGDHLINQRHQVDWLIWVAWAWVLKVSDGGV